MKVISYRDVEAVETVPGITKRDVISAEVKVY